MTCFKIKIDQHEVEVSAGQSVLDAARKLGIEIPTLCYLEKCGALNSCLVCLVKINGKLIPSCGIKVQPGMVVESETTEVHEARRTALELLFSDHVGDCLSPCHRLCPLQMNIPLMLRQIQAGKLDEAIVTVREALPMPSVLGRLCHHPCEQGCRRGTWDDPAAIRDLEKLVADQDLKSPQSYVPSKKSPTRKSVVIIGAGPAGLAAAYFLLRQGHGCTIVDRHPAAGGSLRYQVDPEALPPAVLDAELQHLEKLGAIFRFGMALGPDLTVEGLLLGFDAVLLTVGEISKTEGQALGIEMAPAGIKTNPETFQTSLRAVFAAGRAVKPINNLLRAMSEGRAAAECLDQFLSAKKVQRSDKPFSIVMGRLAKEELQTILHGSDMTPSVYPCDTCAGFTKKEASREASRCLHCDCRASGDCSLQFYAQLYDANPNRYRQPRRKFEQQLQPAGVIFEPGKCILCGICVRLTELAREPLGLTFIGRGFDVRVAAPFNGPIEQGLQNVAKECVQHCPTGALAFVERTD
jgi:NADPH-dependent glutamate synthase beta subunit-like oxidoreductase